jgi:hypothetical protein
MRDNLRLSMLRTQPGSITRSRAGDETPGLQFHRDGGGGSRSGENSDLTTDDVSNWAIRDLRTLA